MNTESINFHFANSFTDSGKGVASAGEKTDFMLKVVPFSNFLFSAKLSLLCFLKKLRKLFLPSIHVLAFSEKEGCFVRYHHFVQNVTRERQRKRTSGEVINERGGADYTGISRRR